MTYANNLKTLFFLLAQLLLFHPSTAQEEKPPKPNILWLSVEDMSPHLGSYGDNTVPTPNIDRLAAEGVRYTNAYGTYGVCAPNRHTIITGMYPTSTGAMAMRTWTRTSAIDQITDPELLNIPVYEATPPAGVRCFPEYLRASGYYCTNNSKTDYQFRAPVTAWDESNGKAHWHNRPDEDMPFFAVFNNETPHESGTFEKRSPRVTDLNDIKVPPYYPDIPEVREDMAKHFDNIYAMDMWVGDMMDQLEADGLLDNTIVVFFSDHGDGLPRAKRWVYDSGIKVPLIVRWPDGRDAGKVNDELVSFVDFAPTTLALAGLEIPEYMQGQVFLGEQKAPAREYIYAFRDRMDPAPETIRAVRDKRYKYVRNYRPDLPYIGFIPYRDRAQMMQAIHKLNDAGKLGPDQWQFWAEKKPLEEFYDTQNDPHEINNLASDPAYFEKLAELRQAHISFVEEHGDLGMMDENDLIRLLWPPDGEQPVTATPELMVSGDNIQLNSSTEGASIAYRFSENEGWKLYAQPIPHSGQESIEAVAIRIGWKESDSVTLKIR
jgi:arylsulfatase A-like enzyme